MKLERRHRAVLALAVIVIILFAVILPKAGDDGTADPPEEEMDRAIVTFTMPDNSTLAIDCEIAETSEQQTTGLMHRASMPEDEGMLFPLDSPRTITLWMNNVEIPLDMIFVDENGNVTQVVEAPVEAPETPENEMARYTSDDPVLWVIELNMGVSAQNGIGPGTHIEIGE